VARRAHERDSRRDLLAADPGAIQPDQIVAANSRAHRRIPLSNLYKNPSNAPGLQNIPFTVKVTAPDTPFLLIPSNSRRLGFVVVAPQNQLNHSLAVFFSYGFPIRLPGAPFFGYSGWGIPIFTTGGPQWRGQGQIPNFTSGHGSPISGTIATDEIWVTIPDFGGGFVFLAGTFIGYESSLALTGRNLR
jgi:hypothetical protein